MILPIETFLDTAKIDALDQSFTSSLRDMNSEMIRDHIDLNELIKSGFITYIANTSLQDKELSDSIIKRHIISQYFDGSKQVKIIKREDLEFGLKNNTESSLYSLKVTSSLETSVFPLPLWPILEFPKDWKKLSKHYQQQFIAGGPSPTFTSWKGLGINKFRIESIILLDRYILDFKKNAIINLDKLLDGLIPQNRRSEKIHFTIVSRIKPEFEGKTNYASELHSEILNKLSSKWPNLSLSIYFIPAKFIHGRYLLTDFYYIMADYGFSLYDERGLKQPRASNLISYHPISNKNAYSIYSNILSQMKSVFYNGNIIQDAGRKNCRLFRIIKETAS